MIQFDYIRCPLHRNTFSITPIRLWVENECEGRVLNLFAGQTILKVNEIRNDINQQLPADYHFDALEFVQSWRGDCFNTILMDPPYSYRKSMELYGGRKASPFRKTKDELIRIVANGGKVITFGYHSVVMGKVRGFSLEKIALFSHGGAIHDTIVSVERKM